MRLRRAFFLALLDRYAGLVVGLALIAAVSRLLAPHEIGVSVLGATVLAFVEVLRDVPTCYLIQRAAVARDEVRVAFTAMLAVSAVAAAALVLGAGQIAAAVGDPGLAPYLRVLALALLVGPFERPLMALMRRDMRFDRLAVVNVSGTAVNAAATVGLAVAGFSYMSFAWALLASNCVVLLLALRFGAAPGIYRPLLRGWREPLRLGGYSSFWGGAVRMLEAMPPLMLGAAGQLGAVGLYGRAQAVSDMPAKLMLAGIGPVAYPALAAEQRAGRGLGPPLMMAVEYITALHWPAFLVLACLAHPAVALLLGEQWLSIVPMVQVLALARLFSAFDVLVYPALMTRGALGSLALSAVVPLPVYAAVYWLAAPHGPAAIAASQLLLAPFFGLVGIACVRRAIPFGWGELGAALRKSAVVAACSALGPAAVVASAGFRFDLPIAAAALAAALAAAGWLAGLLLARHPLCAEVARATSAAGRVLRAVERLEARPRLRGRLRGFRGRARAS